MADAGGRSGGGEAGGGIIVFTLWYIFIAVNYIMSSPIFESNEQKYQCKCRRAPCKSASNSCDIPPDYDIDIRLPDDPPVVPTIEDEEKPTENVKEDEEKPSEDIKEDEDVKVEDPSGDVEENLPPEMEGDEP